METWSVADVNRARGSSDNDSSCRAHRIHAGRRTSSLVRIVAKKERNNDLIRRYSRATRREQAFQLAACENGRVIDGVADAFARDTKRISRDTPVGGTFLN